MPLYVVGAKRCGVCTCERASMQKRMASNEGKEEQCICPAHWFVCVRLTSCRQAGSVGPVDRTGMYCISPGIADVSYRVQVRLRLCWYVMSFVMWVPVGMLEDSITTGTARRGGGCVARERHCHNNKCTCQIFPHRQVPSVAPLQVQLGERGGARNLL